MLEKLPYRFTFLLKSCPKSVKTEKEVLRQLMFQYKCRILRKISLPLEKLLSASRAKEGNDLLLRMYHPTIRRCYKKSKSIGWIARNISPGVNISFTQRSNDSISAMSFQVIP